VKNVCNSKLKKIAYNLLEELVLLLSARYLVACYAITVTNYCFTWYSVVINVMFNTVKPLSIITQRTLENKRMRGNDSCGKVTYFKLFGENSRKIITTRQIFLSNY
jgi:hypothetical protein